MTKPATTGRGSETDSAAEQKNRKLPENGIRQRMEDRQKMRKGKWGIMLMLALCIAFGMAAAEPKVIVPVMNLELGANVISNIVKSNPEEEGINPLTGLALTEEYTPITLVLDNSPEVYPHWGVADADWIVQVPLRPDGGTRLVAVYGGAYPEQAGGVRSARMTTLPVSNLFKAAAAFGSWPANTEDDISVEKWIDTWDYNAPVRYYDLLGTKYKERVSFLNAPQNLSAHIQEIHDSLVRRIKQGKIKFEKRFFLFSDEARTDGDAATNVQMRFIAANPDAEYITDEDRLESVNSACTFEYQEGTGYTRTSRSGVYSDRDSGEALTFANVIVMRVGVEWIGNYPYYADHLRGCGQAEIFQNGKHITGAWYRSGRRDRLVLLDEEGNEIALQRGKTFMVIGDDDTVVSYE